MKKLTNEFEPFKIGDETWIKVQEPEELNSYCYFCDFNEFMPTLHHIIRKSDGGNDTFDNLMPLCPNHHELIHRRTYVLSFNPKSGLYFLVNRKSRELIYPTERQTRLKRKLPLSSIRNNSNLVIKGNLENQGVISVKDFHKRLRETFRLKKVVSTKKKVKL